MVRLDRFHVAGFDRGAPRWLEAAWLMISGLVFSTWLPGSSWRVALLRLFGAKVGTGAIIKPYVKVKFPWRLRVGDHCWIGEHAWLDNLADVTIGDHACISQGAYLCTGSHDWTSESFDLIVKPISIGSHAWLGARSTVAPGCIIGEGTVITMGSLAAGTLAPWQICSGLPAQPVKQRIPSKTERDG